MTRSSGEPIEVTPEIVETGIATQGAIERRLAELGETAHAMLGRYRPHEIEDRQDHIDSKRARAQARKDADRVRAEGREMTAAVDRWSQGVKNAVRQLAAPLDEVYAEYGERVAEYEDGVIEARKEMLRQRYEDFAPALALPAEGSDHALVPFDRLWERFAKAEKWANYGTNDVKAAKSMEAVVGGIAQGERNIDALVAERDRADVKALYFQTLSIDAAMARAGELADARAKVAALEAERASWQAPEPEPEPTVPQPIDTRSVVSQGEYERLYESVHGSPAPRRPEPAPQPSGSSTWVFMCRCTGQQAGELEGFCRRIGVSRMQSFDGGATRYRPVPVKE